MKIFLQLVISISTVLLLSSSSSILVVDAQAVANAFCVDPGCIIPVDETCEAMIEKYEFQGSCCSMESVPETRGCRITIANEGNCYWFPRCSTPETIVACQNDPNIRCHTIFETDTTNACPTSDFDPYVNITTTCAPTQAPAEMPSGGGNGSPTSGATGWYGMVNARTLVATTAGALFSVATMLV
mmetsp:Transcript_16424/g.40064  ORF Transcript_16424/g.40064 Transcript_16424/m.40064 type:complete len:185 (-) Transcript_16424:347-901(-)